MASPKPIHTIVLDAGPMLKNDPSISSLLAKAECLVTVPSVIAEIRDATARSRVETTWMPFLKVVAPSVQSIKAITDFSRRTGDLVVLSKPDLAVLALTYEIEKERNGLSSIRTVPGQQLQRQQPSLEHKDSPISVDTSESKHDEPKPELPAHQDSHQPDSAGEETNTSETQSDPDRLANDTALLQVSDSQPYSQEPPGSPEPKEKDDDSDSDSWITPSNIQKHQAKDQHAAIPLSLEKPLSTACITSDFAMQNVLLSMNLSLLNNSLHRVRTLRTYILRCHACFLTTKEMSKQFCPRCGKPTLTRVSCSTNAKGEFKIHLKKNMQWNTRGDRYSIPKPAPGTAHGKSGQSKGGGKGGWGHHLVLAEDQKEYVRAMGGDRRRKETDLMDQDHLPSILTGDRSRNGGRPKIGAGRTVNSRKR
ncbi:MAG: hypothetical protein Q9174_005762 [Haloplaca sp. 1 TL-2023]